jgi:hypothetical protein
MTSNTKGLLVTAFYVLLLEATMQTRSVSRVGFAARIVLWALLALMIVATITSMIRHRRFEPFGQDAAFREIGRWLRALS